MSEKHAVWRPLYHIGFNKAMNDQRITLKMKCVDGQYLNHPIDNIYFMPGISPVQAASVDFVQYCDNLQRAREISDPLPVYLEFEIGEKDDF